MANTTIMRSLVTIFICLTTIQYANAVLNLTVQIPDDATAASSLPLEDFFISIAADWWTDTDAWPYGTSILNMDLSSPKLQAAVSALTPAVWRIGGTRANSAWYEMDEFDPQSDGIPPTTPATEITDTTPATYGSSPVSPMTPNTTTGDAFDDGSNTTGIDNNVVNITTSPTDGSSTNPTTTMNVDPGNATYTNNTGDEYYEEDLDYYDNVDFDDPDGGTRFLRGLQGEYVCKAANVLTGTRWYQLLQFAARTGVKLVFCLNYNFFTRSDPCDILTRDTQEWDPTNARQLLEFTKAHAPPGVMYGFELGNEVTHKGRIQDLSRVGRAYGVLRDLIAEIWDDPQDRPLLMGPASASSEYGELLPYVKDHVDVVTFHKYQDKGSDEMLAQRTLDGQLYYPPSKYSYYVQFANGFPRVWIGEGAMASNSGRAGVTDTFISTLWFTNALGSMSKARPVPISAFCRQSILGGNYALLNPDTHDPYPDFYMMRLWTQIVGNQPVGPVTVPSGPQLLTHAFCGKSPGQLVVVTINTDGHDDIALYVNFPEGSRRETYLLQGSPDVYSHSMSINGELQTMDELGGLPDLKPLPLPGGESLEMPPYSIAFVIVYDSTVAVCGGPSSEPAPPQPTPQDQESSSGDVPFTPDALPSSVFGLIVGAVAIVVLLGAYLCCCSSRRNKNGDIHYRKRRHEILAQDEDGLWLEESESSRRITVGNNDDELL